MTQKRVIVLGASGFIGARLVKHLAKSGIATQGFSSKQLDLSDPSALQKLSDAIQPEDTLVFASCITRDKGSDDLPTLMKNLKMAENVGLFLEKKGCAQLIYLSSDAVYKDTLPLIREDSEKDPAGLYPITQLVREKMMIHSASKKGIPLTILRLCSVYGFGDTHNSYGPNRFLKTALADGKISLFGEGEEKRDHLFVGDVCRLIELCAVQQKTGVFNLATGESTSFYQVAETVVKISGKSVTGQPAPGKPVKIECSPRNNPVTHKAFDTTALIKAFPTFKFTSLEEGLGESPLRETILK